jgi:pseudouridine-5'-phosphate glycosidase
MKELIEYGVEVRRAKAYNLPIVALESTIISHGMPYPQNVQTAKECERIIREAGAVPATIAIINGKLKVGLSEEELDKLGKDGPAIQKTSRRDISYFVANKIDGATTVSATMMIAHMAGIKVFATGGIGGVHRGAEETMDISADLDEFAQTPVTVVSAGAKSILDLEKTLEYLETKGVPVFGYQTDEFPAFYTQKSGLKVTHRINGPEEMARIILTQEQLNISTGMLVANPIPAEHALNQGEMDKIIEQALHEMKQKGIKGKETTPYLLAKIVELTSGKSLEANIQLVYNNCKVAAQIASAVSRERVKGL